MTEPEYTTESVEAVEPAYAEADEAPREPVVIDRPIQTVGRRKEAVVRVRLVPGTGQFHLDGRTLENYFPNKVHQQLIKAPLVTVDRVEQFDIYAHLDGGGPSGQAGALRLARRWSDEGLVGPDAPEGQERIIIVNLSGRGDKDVATAAAWFGLGTATEEKDPLEEMPPGEEQ